MADKLILDALIKREDFEINKDIDVPISDMKSTLSIPDLEYNSFFFRALRKPDFQRETNDWTIEKNYQFIESFINGELIPSVILWKSDIGLIFVIDGSHRISALSAWINDDYGDGEYSNKFFKQEISSQQKKIAQKARKIINTKLGPFVDYKNIDPEIKKTDNKKYMKAMNLGTIAIQIQWVKGDSKKAEESFFKINEKATPLDNTEKKIIKNRNKPIGIAARAIMRSGTGHNYWRKFEGQKQNNIEDLAKEINQLLFSPEYSAPIKTIDLPIGGRVLSNQGLALVHDTVMICNRLNEKILENIKEDTNGDQTIQYLKNTKKLLLRINSIHSGSLGLHPIIYFYSIRGMHKVASYYGILEFIIYLQEKNRYDDYISVRQNFETILLKYEFLIQQIVRHDRQSINGYKNIKEYYVLLLDELLNGSTIENTITTIQNTKKFSYLSLAITKVAESKAKKFSRDKKTSIFIKESLKSLPKCAICKGALDTKSITIDHIKRKEDGGLANIENGQLTHPYCNTTYKN